MTTIRRTVATIAAAALALTLASCSSDDDRGTDNGGSVDAAELEGHRVGAMENYGVGTPFVASEPVEFSLLYRDHPNYPYKKDWAILEHLVQDHNVTFNAVNAPLSDFDDRKALLIGAGDAPDILPITYPGQEVAFVAGGAILPVSDYLEYLPNFSQKVEDWGLQQDVDNLRQEDGKFYLLPGLRESVASQYTVAVRQDVWDDLGIDDPQTWDDFADALREVKKTLSGDQYPYTERWELNATLNAAAPNFGTAAGWGYGEGTWWDGEKFVYTGATDEYRDLVTYFAGLVEEGLLDPEGITQDDDQAIQKLGSGEAMAIGANDQEILNYRTTFEESGNADAEVKLLRLPDGPAGGNVAAGSRLESGLMISADAAKKDNFVALLQFVDWLYFSDEGMEFAKWGVEGETFERDADGTRVLDEDIDINGLNPGASQALNVDYGYHNGVFMLAHGSTDDLTRSMLRDEVMEFQEAMADKTELDTAPAAPLDELEREQVTLWQGALEDYVKQSTAQFILGQRDLGEWDAYVSQLESMNMQAYLDVVNEAYQRTN